jgi:Tol biopolymer transport system component
VNPLEWEMLRGAGEHILSPSLSDKQVGGIEGKMQAEGEVVQLPVDKIDFPRWSPDGSRIWYADRGRDYVVDVATGETTVVAEGGPADWFDEDTLVIASE